MDSNRYRIAKLVTIVLETEELIDANALEAGEVVTSRGLTFKALGPTVVADFSLETDDLKLLDGFDQDVFRSVPDHFSEEQATRIRALSAAGILIGEDAQSNTAGAIDHLARKVDWLPLSGIQHYASKWTSMDAQANPALISIDEVQSRIEDTNWLPETIVDHSAHAAEIIRLPAPQSLAIDAALGRRITCRNFDGEAWLDPQALSDVLFRSFGVVEVREVMPGLTALKKHVPSGGGLHPIEAYLLIQRVKDVKPGLYHYNCVAHTLELARELNPARAREVALTFVAGQVYFANANVLIAMVARFQRNFWKYKNHPKALRVIHLEAGHLSQSVFLAASELGLGAYITGAINETQIESAFEVDGITEGAIAVCGIGVRSGATEYFEFVAGDSTVL